MEGADLFDIPGSDKYDIEEEVGHGTFSEVHRARERSTGELVALKHMYLQEEGGVLPRHVQRELRLLHAVRHPAVVALRGVEQQGFSVALVLEHCLTDLRVLLAHLRGGPLDLAMSKAVAQQLLQALAAVHAAGFVHRDVATSNLLIAPAGTLRLADFGQARRLPAALLTPSPAAAGAAQAELPATQPTANGVQQGGGGVPSDMTEDQEEEEEDALALPGSLTPGACLCTRWYKAPELLFNARSYTQGVDMWSAGCVLAEMLTGRPLFAGASDIAQLAAMSDLLGSISEERWPGVRDLPDWGKLIFHEQPPADLSAALGAGVPPEAVQLVAGLLQYNPAHRLTAQQALQSPWFAQEPLPAGPEALLGITRQALE